LDSSFNRRVTLSNHSFSPGGAPSRTQHSIHGSVT
jgi:hypothetical protein